MYKLFQTSKEQVEPVEGQIQGDIPGWVTGSLYRNGPGMYEVGECKYEHLFDAHAIFQRFHIANKTVTYQSRFLDSNVHKTNLAAQRIVISGLGTVAVPDPCKNIFQRFLSYFEPEEKNDNTNVNIYPVRDELYSATESNEIFKVDPDTLETLGKVDISKYIAVNSATAHPHVDHDGTVHNIGYSYKGKPAICLIKIPSGPATSETGEEFPRGEVISSIPCAAKVNVNYLHSFAMTENFYVYAEQPLYLNLLKILTARYRGVPKNSGIDWWPNEKVRFRIINKKTKEEVNQEFRYESDGVMIFHHVNAYEEDGHIVVDLVGLRSYDSLDAIYMKHLTSKQVLETWRQVDEPEPRRYVIPLNLKDTPAGENLVKISNTQATATRQDNNVIDLLWEPLTDQGMEFPMINYSRVNGKKYRYTYGVGWHNKGPHFHTVMKIDVENKTFKEWAEDNCYPAEPVFVPNPDGTDEDDGVLLTAVNCTEFEEGKEAFLLVVDAKTMKEKARVTFKNIPRFPRDFHGMFRNDPSTETSGSEQKC